VSLKKAIAAKNEQKEQSKKFVQKARELGCDEDPKAFERAFSKIVPPKKPAPPKPEKKKPRRGARG
jgi:hypothetical protein